ncbi:MAG: transposase [Planctomycetota bacterium]|jgi:transposase-like protein
MKKHFSGPQIVAKLRQADVLIGQGKTVPEVCKEIEISQQTYYHWRQKYGGMSPDMIKQLMVLQKENA